MFECVCLCMCVQVCANVCKCVPDASILCCFSGAFYSGFWDKVSQLLVWIGWLTRERERERERERIGSREGGREEIVLSVAWVCETSKPTLIGTPPPARPHLLILPKHLFKAETKHPNRWPYCGHSHSNHHTIPGYSRSSMGSLDGRSSQWRITGISK